MNAPVTDTRPVCPTCQRPLPKTPPEVRAWMRERTAAHRAAKKRAQGEPQQQRPSGPQEQQEAR